ncbi:MAG TPA: GNAT family N-acetyltransferase [Bacteroidales bacterium]|nr:GNAT family N-acetyltransferase [Bacteroidales bacterium]
MEIRYVTHTAIDDRKWDACIRRSVNSRLYAYSWYLNLVCERWDALVDGDYEQVFPLPVRRKAGMAYVYTPPFVQQLGLFSPGHITPGLVHAFLKAIPSQFKVVDLRLNTLNKVSDSWGALLHRNYELSLIGDYERIRSVFSENLRRSLRKAEIAGMERISGLSPAELIRLFRENRGRGISTLGEREYQILERLAHAMMHRGLGQIVAATAGGNRILAGALIAEMPGQSIFLFSATERRENNHGALAWLIDLYLREHAGTQRVFDFEGSDDEGLGRFYAGFGAQETNYPGLRLNRLPLLLRPLPGLFRETVAFRHKLGLP